MLSIVTAMGTTRRAGLQGGNSSYAPVLWGLATWTALCVGIPVLTTDGADQVTLAAALHLGVVLYSGTRLAGLIRRGAPKWFDLMFWSFCYVWLGIAALAQALAGANPYRVPLDTSDQQIAAVVALAGMSAFDIGKLWGRRRAKMHARADREVSIGRTKIIALSALIVTPILIVLLGGFSSLALTRTERSALFVELGLFTDASKVTGGVLVAASYSLPLVATLGLIHCLRVRPELRMRVAWVAGLILLVMFALTIGNPISAPRYWVGTILLSLLFSLRRINTGLGFRVVAWLVLTGLIFVFPYADRFRYRNYVATQSRSLAELLVYKLDYDASAQMVNVVDYVQERGLSYGHQLLGAIGFAIPRQFWPEKPMSTGTVLGEHIHFHEQNISSPLWVEAYFDGGFVGVFVLFALLGAFAAWIQSRSWIADGSTSYRGLLLCVSAAYLPILLRGSLLSSMSGLAFLIVLIAYLTTRVTLPTTGLLQEADDSCSSPSGQSDTILSTPYAAR